MADNNNILCVCSSYEQKYYFNGRFGNLPDAVKDELHIMCVLYTEDVGGIITLEFADDGRLLIHVTADEGDLLFDEIGSELKIKQMKMDRQELFEQLENYYRMMFAEE